ncbi:M20 metallopeptidase family protein [Mobilicoccus pelagius]|uniref:Putative hydrolase n=1 Tax=Mobilicoccus pelagius NBRC 104925 TaxID=1089455 RepID=H5US65_9MICO|nr:M20 family metallopeptidase [Mobilicoccus pelagius]GAB48573.1 putative hydrolase [Mobilicoccus pelagius NBRC 104925]
MTTRPELVDLRRTLHRDPEVGLHLPRTQKTLLDALEGLPLEITTGGSLTSITALLRGGRRGEGDVPAVLLRADMDGLPVREETGVEYASTTGTMHACGHDLHMTMLVGAVRDLCERREDLPGDVVFMFQPGEEGHDGAGHMIREGVLEASGRRVDAAYAVHVWSALEPGGTFATKPGAMMAASHRLQVKVVGQGGHGSTPHRGKDPVPALAEMVTALQVLVTRRFDVFDPVVITVGSLHAGTTCNVIPEFGEFDATVRSFSHEAEERLFDLVPQVLRGVADSHGVEVEIDFERQYPVTVNDDAETHFVAEVVEDLFGPERHSRWRNPLGGAEDFSRVLEEVPGAFIGLSAVPEGGNPATAPFNHSAYATFDDSVLDDGVRLFVELATRRLAALDADR